MVVAFWHLTIRGMLSGENRIQAMFQGGQKKALQDIYQQAGSSGRGAFPQQLHHEERPSTFPDILCKGDYQEGHWNYSFLWYLLLL